MRSKIKYDTIEYNRKENTISGSYISSDCLYIRKYPLSTYDNYEKAFRVELHERLKDGNVFSYGTNYGTLKMPKKVKIYA